MKKIVDNFRLFERVLNFKSDDEFYFVQVLVRKKDGNSGPGINGDNKNRLIKFYRIRSIQELQQLEHEIKGICNLCNARAYIHPTKRSFSEVADEYLRVSTDVYLSKDYKGLIGSYSTACGKSFIKSDKKFIIDLDGEDVKKANEIADFIDNECKPDGIKLQYIVPTVHGMHFITKPFDVGKFTSEYPNIDVHKNNPTLLYYASNSD